MPVQSRIIGRGAIKNNYGLIRALTPNGSYFFVLLLYFPLRL